MERADAAQVETSRRSASGRRVLAVVSATAATLLCTALLTLTPGHAGAEPQDLEAGIRAFQAGRFAEALQIFTPLARSGDPNAQYQLAFLYLNGLGVPRDPAHAAVLYESAARLGLADAQLATSHCYAQGRGVARSDVWALGWCLRARAGGAAGASAQCAEIRRRMSPEAIAEAERIATDLLGPEDVSPHPTPEPSVTEAIPAEEPARPDRPEPSGASRIEEIRILRHRGVATVIEIVGNGVIDAQSFTNFRLEGERPREVLKIAGIVHPFEPSSVAVGGDHVDRVRIGLHPDVNPPQIHLVFDLRSRSVRLVAAEPRGKALRVQLAAAGATPPPLWPEEKVPQHATPMPPPTPTARPVAAPTAVGSATPAAIQAAQPTATPPAGATASPAATPRSTPRPTPTPTVMPTRRPVPTRPARTTPTPRPAQPDRGQADRGQADRKLGAGRQETAASAGSRIITIYREPLDPHAPRPVVGGRREATRVLEIVASRSSASASLLRITADGGFREDGWLHFRSTQNPLIYTIAVPGVTIKSLDRKTVPVNHPPLDEVVVTTGNQGRERGVVIELHLSSVDVDVSRVTVRGPHLVAELVAATGSTADRSPDGQSTQAVTRASVEPSSDDQPSSDGQPTAVEPAPATASRILEISTRREPDGATLITVTGDGPIPTLRHRHIRVSDDPPRDVISIVGVEMPDAPPVIPVDDACLRNIKIVHRQDQTPRAVHLVLNLTSPEVRHESVAGRADQIVVRLLSPGSGS